MNQIFHKNLKKKLIVSTCRVSAIGFTRAGKNVNLPGSKVFLRPDLPAMTACAIDDVRICNRYHKIR